jgi:hypothetical protein
MLVSTKHLSLMKWFVSGMSRLPAEIQARAEPRHGALSRPVIPFTFLNQFFEFRGEQATDRAALFGGQYSRFPQNLGIQFW